MGIEEIAMLDPADLVRYRIQAEGDRLRLLRKCKELTKESK